MIRDRHIIIQSFNNKETIKVYKSKEQAEKKMAELEGELILYSYVIPPGENEDFIPSVIII